MVNRDCRDDEVKRAPRQGVFEVGDAQLNAIARQHAACAFEHLGTRVDCDEPSVWMACEHTSRGLTGADSELQHVSGSRPRGRRRFLLKTFIFRYLRSHQLEIARRIPLKRRHAWAG